MTTGDTPLKILLHDNVIPYVGSWSYIEAFRRAGHTVQSVSRHAGIEKYLKSFLPKLYLRLFRDIAAHDRRHHYEKVNAIVQSFRPQIFITAGGHYLGKDFIQSLRKRGIWTLNINHDDFFSQFRANWTHTQHRAIPAYNQILTTRMVNVGEIEPMNPNVEFFPFAYDPNVHRPIALSQDELPRWQSDVVFVGQWADHRGKVLSEIANRLKLKYAIHGPSWENLPHNSAIRPYVSNTHVWGEDMAKALGHAKIALGFLRKENRDDYTQRSFEIPGCGGVLLAERTEMHKRLYDEGVSAEFFDSNSVDELESKIRQLLANEEYRQNIRAEGMARLRSGNHTYDDRVKTILHLYSQQFNGRPETRSST